MIVGKWPVDKEEVNIVQVQISQAFRAGKQHITLSVHVVPHLSGDEELFALDGSLVKRSLKDLANQVFVAVNRGAVKHPVANLDCAGNRAADLLCREPVGTECSHADGGHISAVIELSFRHD